MEINWNIKTFNELTNKELYQIIQLRIAVFVVEQNCPFQDLDDKDFACLHLMGQNESHELMAYTRLVPKDVSYQGYTSIGRVVTSPKARNFGIGRKLMTVSIAAIQKAFGNFPIKIGAQLYLKHFYESFGFEVTSEVYLEDGIEHIEMLLPLQTLE